MIKTLRKVKIEWNVLNLSKGYLQKIITNIILCNEILKALNGEQDENSGFYYFYLTFQPEQSGKKKKWQKDQKGRNKTHYFSDNMDVISKVNMLPILGNTY